MTDATDPRAVEVQKASGWFMVLGIASIVLGTLAILSPLPIGLALGIIVGAVIAAHGVVQIVHAFRARSWGGGILQALGGALALICGGLVLAFPAAGLGSLTLLLAAFLLMAGALRIALGLELRPVPGWGWLLFEGAMAVLLGVLIVVQWPLSGAWAVGTLVGLRILFNGWSMVMLSLAARRALKQPQALAQTTPAAP